MKVQPPELYQGYPVVDSRRMREIDARSLTELHLSVDALMENAGAAVAAEVLAFLRDRLGKDPARSVVTVCCGRGNNGGDGLVAARRLKEAGADVAVYLAPPRREGSYPEEVLKNRSRAEAAGVAVREAPEEASLMDERLAASDAIVDALLGTGSSGKPAGAVHKMIQRMTKSARPVLAVDIPSGLNPDTGYHSGAVVAAARTCALGLPKRGLLAPAARRYVGELFILDIGFPRAWLESAAKRPSP